MFPRELHVVCGRRDDCIKGRIKSTRVGELKQSSSVSDKEPDIWVMIGPKAERKCDDCAVRSCAERVSSGGTGLRLIYRRLVQSVRRAKTVYALYQGGVCDLGEAELANKHQCDVWYTVVVSV